MSIVMQRSSAPSCICIISLKRHFVQLTRERRRGVECVAREARRHLGDMRTYRCEGVLKRTGD